MKVAIIFGGSGYIGSHLVEILSNGDVFDRLFVCDIHEPKFCIESHSKDNVSFFLCDVRVPINIPLHKIDMDNSWVFNFAAVHREPGHEFQEYFDTNIPGAENIIKFANKTGVKNILFTSSIAPYGKSIEERTEKSPLYPETGYGISKALAEQIHQKWLAEDQSKRLIIVRPSVIFGPKDPGNVYRMIKGIKKGTFVLPNGGNIIKAYGYIYGLIDSMLFTMSKNEQSLIVYNYVENPTVPLCEMVKIAKNELGYTKPVLKVSVRFLAAAAFILQIVFKLAGKNLTFIQ